MTLLEQITDYSLNLRLGDIPEDARDLAKTILFDSIGTGLGGYQSDLGRKALRYATSMMPGDEASLLGAGERASLEGAAFANGVMIKILGMDDSHRSAGHIASQVVPVVLSVSEAYGASGADMLVAIVAAYDFAVRVGRQVRPMQRAAASISRAHSAPSLPLSPPPAAPASIANAQSHRRPRRRSGLRHRAIRL